MREALHRPLGDFGNFTRARKVMRVPVVLTRDECQRLFSALEGVPRLMAELMYGASNPVVRQYAPAVAYYA